MDKTRPAMELVREFERRRWKTGFLNGASTRQAGDRVFRTLAADPRPLLIVVDYAETQGKPARRLLEAMARERRAKARILFLARRRRLVGNHEAREG